MPKDKYGTPQPELVNSKKYLENHSSVFGIKCLRCKQKFQPQNNKEICEKCLSNSCK